MSLRPKKLAGGTPKTTSPKLTWHGDKAGICYRTETGAKTQALKGEGDLIVSDRAGFWCRRDESQVYPDEKIVSVRKDGKWVKPKNTKSDSWTKNDRNKWTWNEDPEFTVQIYKYDYMRFYGADVWWRGHPAEIDGAPTRSDMDYLVQEFLKNENPREHFEKTHRYVLEDIGYKKEDGR